MPRRSARSTLRGELAKGVRQAADILDQVGWDFPGAVSAQSEGVDEAAKALADGGDDLVVAPDRGE